MTFTFLPDVALADVAFRAEGGSLDALFESCALALTDVMVNPETVALRATKEFSIESVDLDRLLYDFLTELIIAKDVESMLFRRYSVKVAPDGRSLRATGEGEAIDRGRHELRNDVKAVTMHMFGVEQRDGRWTATVVLDI